MLVRGESLRPAAHELEHHVLLAVAAARDEAIAVVVDGLLVPEPQVLRGVLPRERVRVPSVGRVPPLGPRAQPLAVRLMQRVAHLVRVRLRLRVRVRLRLRVRVI